MANYYANTLYGNIGHSISAISTDASYNIYFIDSSGTSLFPSTLYSISGSNPSNILLNTSQLVTLDPSGNTLTINAFDMMVGEDTSGYSLFILYSCGSSVKYKINKYTIGDSSGNLALTYKRSILLPKKSTKFATNCTANLIYLTNTSILQGITQIIDFNTINMYNIIQPVGSLTYRTYTDTSGFKNNYLYGVSGTGSLGTSDPSGNILSLAQFPGKIYEINTAQLPDASGNTLSQTTFNCPHTTYSTGVILWVNNDQSFYLSDRLVSSGNDGSGNYTDFTGGQIYQYKPTFNLDGFGNMTTFVESNLLVHGNGNAGVTIDHPNNPISYTTSITAGTTLDTSSQYVYQTNAMTWNLNSLGIRNLYSGTTGTPARNTSGYLVKYYNPTSGSSIGGDPHIKTINGKIYMNPNDYKYCQLLNYVTDDTNFVINCSTILLTKDKHPLDRVEFVKTQDGDHLEYVTHHMDDETFPNMFFEYTFLEHVYIYYNKQEMIIDMNTLDIIKQIDCTSIEVEEIINDKGIYSIHHNTYHKKTKYTKHKKITCNIGAYNTITLLLSSDTSIVDMHNVSIKIEGIDSDLLGGGMVSENKLIKLDCLKYTG
jgi:hypothetical protein